MHRLRNEVAAVSALCVLSLSACAAPATSSQPNQATQSSQPTATSGSGGTKYTTSNFSIPLTVTVSETLASPPTDDSPGLLSWTASGNDNNRVRFLVPAEVYPPDSTEPVPPPSDFVGYIQSLADHGGLYSDETTMIIDGVSATVLTARSESGMDGSLGCPSIGADRGEGCFGLQPELMLRIAVMEVGGTPLLVWARTDGAQPDTAFLAEFQEMLATIDFS